MPDSLDDETVVSVELTLRTQAASSLESTATQLANNVQSGGGLNGNQIALTMRALTACRSAGLLDNETSVTLATGGALLHHLHQAVAESHPEAAARCVLAYLQSVPDGREPDEVFGNSQSGHQQLLELLRSPEDVPGTLDALLALLGDDGGLRELALILDVDPPEPVLVNQAFARLIQSDPTAIDPEFIEEHWSKIRSNLAVPNEPDAFEEFIRNLPTLPELTALVVSGQFETDDAALYLTVLLANWDEGLATWAATGLQSVRADQWARSLEANDGLVALLLELTRRGVTVRLATAYLDGLELHARAAMHPGDDRDIGESLSELVSILTEGNRALLTRRVYEVLGASAGAAAPRFFELYGSFVADRELLLRQPNFVEGVCRTLLVQRNRAGLRWLADVVLSEPDLLEAHDDQHAATDFRERVRDALGAIDEDEPAAGEIRALAEALRIEAAPNDSESGTSDAGNVEMESARDD